MAYPDFMTDSATNYSLYWMDGIDDNIIEFMQFLARVDHKQTDYYKWAKAKSEQGCRLE